ncbi:MAG: hypothetical protein M3393_05260 [Actinomycetota bacterium]|nr:hypothetical protein [Actinomycetota bacterium]
MTAQTRTLVGFSSGDVEAGLDPNGSAHGMTEPVAYWHVEDIAQSLEPMLDAGAVQHQGVTDAGGGKLISPEGIMRRLVHLAECLADPV